jgi:hypothetical protein
MAGTCQEHRCLVGDFCASDDLAMAVFWRSATGCALLHHAPITSPASVGSIELWRRSPMAPLSFARPAAVRSRRSDHPRRLVKGRVVVGRAGRRFVLSGGR